MDRCGQGAGATFFSFSSEEILWGLLKKRLQGGGGFLPIQLFFEFK